jgi:cytochrome b561
MVILIIAEIPAGFLMSYTYGLALKNPAIVPLQTFASQIHHTIGFTLLALAAGRLTWRLLQSQRPAPLGRFYLLSSRFVQPCLYLLLFLLPLSGWSALSVYGLAPIWMFGWQGVVPPLLPKLPYDSPYGYGFFAHIHIYGLWAGAALLSLHVTAALWHHFIRKDGLLVRIWPLGKAGQGASPPGPPLGPEAPDPHS